ncbi:nucleoside triphosphate pyrophosphohydrolase [Mucilaginibacter sp.]|uniref:nucleoside triphosphate pyrophosphohydrolase n=1 Tax=Mucilaginibacter sp. TaxID=1882438 RepID=UPI0025FBBA9D|nr:nucleoside triphosphate pyrophosphohydrolase [Mucilaginibacter sp.]
MIGKYLLNSQSEYQENLVGKKVINLIPYTIFTPEFIVLSTEFYVNWQLDPDNFVANNNETITAIALYFQRRDHERIILRSSCVKENIVDRGKYYSESCKPNVAEIRKALQTIYKDFQVQKDDSTLELAILIQVFHRPKSKGHLSNERRVNASKFVWLLEEEFQNGDPNKSTPFLLKDEPAVLDLSLQNSLNYPTAVKNLKKFATFFSQLPEVYHIEWLWDGGKLWLVQVDHEATDSFLGTKPGTEWKVKKTSVSKEQIVDLEVFETVDSTVNHWRKIECVKTFIACRLPYWPIYILENEAVIEGLAKEETELSLITDLKKILSVPIVIRTETINQGYLSPRTDTIFTHQEALKFLLETTKTFIDLGYQPGQFCFLVHQFIPSTAGALSFTKPNTHIVRIDSTWGIVEGLYYHPYDSFEYNKNDTNVLKKIRCKSNYIDVNSEGMWYLKRAGINYDWTPSLTDEQVRTIANYTQIIAKHLHNPVNVMFFVNKSNNYPEILPWFYTKDEISDIGTIYNNFLSVKNKVVIKSQEDFKKLKNSTESVKKKNLFIDLNIKLFRNMAFIDEVATYAKEHDYTVDIKGSMLSHPYYIFHSKGVNIRCIDPFQSDYDIKKFYKLVRDKIPAMISENDEIVKIRRVSPEELLPLLKSKAVEEANEFYWARTNEDNIEEMSDVLEVLRGACKLYNLTLSDLEDIANKKRDKRGGFEDGVVLVATKEQSAIKLTPEITDLFSEEDKELDVKSEPVVQLFKKGEIDNLKSLTEVNRILLPYINNLASKTNSFRYFLKDEKYNSITFEYDPKNIIITLEVLTSDLKDPSQLNLFVGPTEQS